MRHLPLLSLLAACASPPADLLDEAEAPSLLAAFEAPPPSPPSFRLRAENFVAGDTATLVVQGAPPNTTIHFAHSRTGIGEGGCPPSLNGACGALLRRIKVSPRTAQTDGRGNASLTFTVPAARDGQYVVIQAALADTPWQMSNPVARPIGPPGTPRLPGADLDGDGFTINDGDCADHDAAFHPLAADIVGDTRDWNCDDIDGMDFDRDGHTSATIGGDDCDDLDDNVRPGGVEVCDGLDNDCDLAIDEDAADAWVMYVDADLDGAGDPGASALACAEAPGFSFAPNDCDDTDSTRYPGAPEQCDVEDDDCDGLVDEDAIDGFGAWLDVDLDGYGDATNPTFVCGLEPGIVLNDLDCDDATAARAPLNPEWCDDLDNDCDLVVDEGAFDAPMWRIDADSDGYNGDAEVSSCTAPVDHAGLDGDCDDAVATTFPGAPEVCDGLDQDCDAEVDEGVPGDGNGCEDPGEPVLPPVRNLLHATFVTGSNAGNGTDTMTTRMHLNATTNFTLGTEEYDDFDLGKTDVHVYESANVTRATIDRFRLTTHGGESDNWRITCAQVSLDGEVIYCNNTMNLTLGSGGTSDWTDPLGLHVSCSTCFPHRLTDGPYVGAVGPDTVKLWYRTDATRRVEIRVASTAIGLDTATPVAIRYTDAARDFTDVVDLEHLTPSSTWHYRVSVDGATPVSGSFETGPATGSTGTLRLALGSAALNTSQPIFDTIAAADPDAFLFLGNAVNSASGVVGAARQFYRAALTITDRKDFLRDTPTLAVWDEYDYAALNGNGATANKANALRVFEEYWANPYFGTATTDGAFSKWSWGDVDVFLLDARYHRSGATMLGAEQQAWLEAELLASNATFKLLASGPRWTRRGTTDAWQGFPDAREDLYAFIADNAISGVVLLSGDAGIAEHREEYGGYGGYTMPEITVGPLANAAGSCDAAIYLDRDACYAAAAQYTMLAIDTTAPDPSLIATVYSSAGVAQSTTTWLASELVPYAHDNGPAAVDYDVNGDGYADLVVGAPGEGIGAVGGGGLIHLMFGSTDLITGVGNEGWHQDSAGVPGDPETNDRFGDAVAVGDFNADGFADVVVGAPMEDIGATANSGYVEILPGTADGLTTTGLIDLRPGLNNTEGTVDANDNFGRALAVGDFDGDGYDDLATASPGDSTGGVVQIFYGSATGANASRDALLTQTAFTGGDTNETGDAFGTALVAADFNGDGYDDLAIGHPDEDFGAVTNAGKVTVVFGGAGGIVGASTNLEFTQDTDNIYDTAETNDRFGATLAAGDIDGDGLPELLVGASAETIGASGSGLVIAVTFAGTTLVTDAAWRWFPSDGGLTEAAGDAFGCAIAVGDFDADGIGDLAIGAQGRMSGALDNAGSVFIFPGTPSMPTWTGAYQLLQSDHAETAAEANDQHGNSVFAADFNADGFVDLVVGSPTEAVGAITAGHLMVYPGSFAGLDPAIAQVWNQDRDSMDNVVETNDELGQSLP